MTVIDWYLIRHAPVLAAPEKLYRSADEPADISNGAQLDRLAACLPNPPQQEHEPQLEWMTSPLQRSLMTARALAERAAAQQDITEDIRLMEQDFGDWFGLSFDELWQKIKHLPPHNWSLLAADSCPPGGESFLDVWQRVGEFMEEKSPALLPTSRIIISHAGIIRAIVGHILQMTPDQALSFGCDPLSLTHVQYHNQVQYHDQAFAGGRWRLVTLNQNCGE